MNEAAGPKAPQDPVERRSGFYMMYDNVIESTARPDGSFSHEIYLEGRLADKAKYTGGVTDEELLVLLGNWEGFRRLVHSIGITVQARNSAVEQVRFVYQNLGKTHKYETGTRIELACPTDGREVLLVLDEYEWSPDDDVPGSFSFVFEHESELATVNVMFYLHEGFNVPIAAVEEPVEFGSPSYKEMIARSLLSTGNTIRLKAAIEKTRQGEEVTIAYIGGSLTQGAGAVPLHEQCYARQAYELFKQRYGRNGGESIKLIKAGIGGTSSELGVVRYDRDVLRDGAASPDIVIIEFAVNDVGDETDGNCYESLVLKALNERNQPAVVLLFSVFVNDWNLQDRLAPVGWHYDLPMVSIKDAVVEQFKLTKAEGNVISKRQFFYDIYHPANDGHRVMADCLLELFQAVDDSPAELKDIDIDKEPVIGRDFSEVKLLDRSNAEEVAVIDMGGFCELDLDLQMVEMDVSPRRSPQFPHNWMHEPGKGAPEFRMTLSSKRLLLVFKDSGSPEFGCVDVWVDGRIVKRLNPHENGWTHCNAVILYDEQEVTEHTVVLAMAEGEEQKRFTVLGFGYC